MTSILFTLLAGVAATLVMTLVLRAVAAVAGIRTDLSLLLGRGLTGRREASRRWGAALHLTTGALAALVYVGVWSIFGFDGLLLLTGLGALVGLAHGLVATQVLVALQGGTVRESERLGVAVPCFAAHVFYGVTLGALTGAIGLHWPFVTPIL